LRALSRVSGRQPRHVGAKNKTPTFGGAATPLPPRVWGDPPCAANVETPPPVARPAGFFFCATRQRSLQSLLSRIKSHAVCFAVSGPASHASRFHHVCSRPQKGQRLRVGTSAIRFRLYSSAMDIVRAGELAARLSATKIIFVLERLMIFAADLGKHRGRKRKREKTEWPRTSCVLVSWLLG
jgi:hypothetical protein